jgi:hypothetical protein
MEVANWHSTIQDDRPILETPLFDRLCTENDWVNLRNSKDAMVSMIVEPLRPYIGRLVYGSLVYPEKFHQNNLTTDIHHFLRQVFQRCKPLSWKDPQLRRVFFEEVKDGEGAHCHFFMETPHKMSVPEFAKLCETRWRGIATRNRRYAMQMKRLKRGAKRSMEQPTTVLIKKGMSLIGQTKSNKVVVLPDDRTHQGLAVVVEVKTLDELTAYSLKWKKSGDARFSSDLMVGGSELQFRGHSTKLVLL